MNLKIALSKGALFGSTLDLLEKSGFDIACLKDANRQLFVESPDGLKYILARPTDVPTFVEYGAADLGIAGKDVMLEEKREVFELADLKFGWCQFILAAHKDVIEKTDQDYKRLGQLRVATKYPNVTEDFFAKKGVQAEIITLRGSIELAPLVGLADQIFDLTSSGRTLKENNLEIIDKSHECTSRLIANYVSNKLKFGQIEEFMEKLEVRPACRQAWGER